MIGMYGICSETDDFNVALNDMSRCVILLTVNVAHPTVPLSPALFYLECSFPIESTFSPVLFPGLVQL